MGSGNRYREMVRRHRGHSRQEQMNVIWEVLRMLGAHSRLDNCMEMRNDREVCRIYLKVTGLERCICSKMY